MSRVLVAITSFALILTMGTVGSIQASGQGVTHYYVSLGDSLAEGDQPTGVLSSGYADQLYRDLRSRDPSLVLVKLGCGGESAMSMVYGSLPPSVGASCGTSSFYAQRYPNTAAHTQLAEAMWFLQNHRESVTLVTIDIGANDIGSALGVDSVLTNLPVILSSLRAAAGAALPIVGMNYYDPFLPIVWSTSGHDLGALQSRVNEIVAFNGLLAFLYGQFADPVADVQTQFQVTEMALVGVTPLNVLRECQWTWICVPPATDIHANTAGYGEIAKAFEALFP